MHDASSFSKKSHIVKHWMLEHTEEMTPLQFAIRTVRKFTDCLSRQIAEALRIQYTSDRILNSKCEYLQTVNEEDWERKERERREEEEERY
jgi:hypothetical protein